jgi:hypothetical protein
MRKQTKRASLTAIMCRKSDRTIVDKVVHFKNQDVPNFLAKLEKFEEASKRSRLVIS